MLSAFRKSNDGNSSHTVSAAGSRFPLVRSVLLVVILIGFSACSSQRLSLAKPAEWNSLNRSGPARWVVAYPASHQSALRSLRAHRKAQGLEVVILPDTTPSEIIQRTRDLALGMRDGDCLLLVGSILPATGGQHRMQGKRSDNRYGLSDNHGAPLFPVGRLPSSSSAETRALATRILSFEKNNPSRARQAVFLVGNPMAGGKRMRSAEWLVTTTSRPLIKKAGSGWNISGAADVRGHPFEVEPADFPAAFRRNLNRPYAVGSYFGHSNANIFCASGDMLVFEAADWSQLNPSNNRGVLLSCGCYSLKHPDAHGYRAVKSEAGPLAFIGSTGESYAAIGYLAAKGLANAMANSSTNTIGGLWVEVQQAIATASINPALFTAFDKVDGSDGSRSLRDQRLEHLEMWMLLGDPATRLF